MIVVILVLLVVVEGVEQVIIGLVIIGKVVGI